jgi:hypothetical protein
MDWAYPLYALQATRFLDDRVERCLRRECARRLLWKEISQLKIGCKIYSHNHTYDSKNQDDEPKIS